MSTTKQAKSARTLCPPQGSKKSARNESPPQTQAKSASTTEQAKSARAPYVHQKAGKFCAHLISSTKQAKSARALCPPQSRQNLRATNVHHKSRQNVRATNVHHKAGKICARLMFMQNLRAPYVHHRFYFFFYMVVVGLAEYEPKMKLCH